MLSGGADGSIRGWELNRPQRYIPLDVGPSAIAAAWSDSGDCVFAIDGNRIARFDPLVGKKLEEFALPIPSPSAIALNGHHLATADREAASVRIWELPHGADSVPVERGRLEFDHATDRLAISEDGKRLVAAGRLRSGSGFRVTARAVGDGATHWTREEPSRVVQLEFAADAIYCAILADEGPPQLVLSSNGRTLTALEGVRKNSVRSMAFAPDGRRLAAVGERTIRVWSREDGRTVWSDTLPAPAVGLTFTTDGTRVAVVLENGDVHLREAAGGQELLRLPGPTGAIAPIGSMSIAPHFSVDGRRLFSPSPIGPLLWEAPIDRTANRVGLAKAMFHRSKR